MRPKPKTLLGRIRTLLGRNRNSGGIVVKMTAQYGIKSVLSPSYIRPNNLNLLGRL